MVLILGRESTIRRKKQKYCRKVLRCFLHCGFLRTWSCRFVAKIQLKLMFELFVPTERLRCPHSSKCSFVARMSCYKIGNSRTPQLDCSRLQSRGTKSRNAFAQGQTWGRLREANQLLARRRYCTASALHTGHCHKWLIIVLYPARTSQSVGELGGAHPTFVLTVFYFLANFW